MGTLTTILLAILVFGFLIFIHEFGHYITARLFKVTISEFSIGMGPRLLWYDSKKTGIRYSLSMLPLGGFVSMPGEGGEDEAEGEEDPNRFDKKAAYKRFIIVGAGAFVNILAGFIAMLILTAIINIGSTVIHDYLPAETAGLEISSEDSGLRPGDEIIEVEGKRVVILDELSYEIMRRGHEPLDILVIRDGKEVLIPDVVFPTQTSEGQTFGSLDFRVKPEEKSFFGVIGTAVRKSVLIIRMCWESLYDLITGRYTLAAVSGPVGISSAIGTAANEGPTSFLYIVSLISINLGVMNLLPIPALDGAKLITLLFEMITKKRVPPKVEGIINAIGLALLLTLSAVVLVKDVIQLIF